MTTLTLDLKGCARCNGDGHPGLEFAQFDMPIVIGDLSFEWWALCPTTDEPILMRVLPETPE